jgi:hypothetical protein
VRKNRNIHSQHQCVAYERGKSLQESHLKVGLPRKSRVQHRQRLLGEFSELVQVLSGPCFISCAATGFQADTSKCEAVENSEEKEANACAKRSGCSSYDECDLLEVLSQIRKSVLWHPAREPEHVHAHQSMERHHIHGSRP